MIFLWTILMVLIWIAIAFWPARVAVRKGHSFIGYFIFSLFFCDARDFSPASADVSRTTVSVGGDGIVSTRFRRV